MSAGGLSEARLQRMHEIMAGYVERGELPGVVTGIWRKGALFVDAVGSQGFGGAPMTRDTIFRIASMTKPVAAAAALTLVEECALRLDDPVDRFLPELADRRVLVRLDGPLDETVPAQRPITLRDLLTFRLGFGMLMAPPDAYPVLKAADDLHIGLGPPHPEEQPEPDEWMRRFATLPLMYQPGERWLYNTGSDILGVLLARVAGRPLEAFLRGRIFEPLGMQDTGFSVPPDQIGRLATSYMPNQQTGVLDVYDEPAGGSWSTPPAFPSAAGGLASTVDDYLAFGRMLLDYGRYSGGRILARPTVEAMTTDQLTPEQKAVSGLLPGAFDNMGWGFGVAVATRRDWAWAVPGRFGWDGGLGTCCYSDPKENLVAVLMTQKALFPLFSPVWHDFWTSVYAAIDD